MNDRPGDSNTTGPFLVVESPVRGNRFMVVDDRGDAELGNWFIASTWHRCDAEIIAQSYYERLLDGRTT
jgi:hypothetical protein